MSSLDCSIKHSFYQKGLIILFIFVSCYQRQLFLKLGSTKKQKPKTLDFNLEASRSVCVYRKAEIYKVVVLKSLIPPHKNQPTKKATRKLLKYRKEKNHLGADLLVSAVGLWVSVLLTF